MPQKEEGSAHTHTVSFQQEDVADACTTLMMLHTISALELDHHTHTLLIYILLQPYVALFLSSNIHSWCH